MTSPGVDNCICLCHRETGKNGRVLSPTWISVLITWFPPPPFDNLYCVNCNTKIQLIHYQTNKNEYHPNTFDRQTHTHSNIPPEQLELIGEPKRGAERNRPRGERLRRDRWGVRTILLLMSSLSSHLLSYLLLGLL